MKLYKEVLIESAEQAEALPAGTLARHAAGSGMDHAHKLGPLPGHDNSFMWISLSGPVGSPAIVGWTALVPIEAEEEWDDKVIAQAADEMRNKIVPGSLDEIIRDALIAYHRLSGKPATPREEA